MPFWKCFSCFKWFQNEEVVTKLDYSNCALTDVPPDVSQHERTLEELYLSSNRIRTLSPQLFYCQGIRVLFVNDNELESLPNAIGSLKQLQKLNLVRNSLPTVPDNIKLCKNLTRLDLSLNNLQRFPDAITSLISLQELLLNETNLEFLPANFGRLVNLRILELRSNNLLTLPKSMSRLSNLNRIDIGANEFQELPEVICQLSQLRELWIDVNRIRRIPPSVSNLRELTHFEANNNMLTSLPNEISNWLSLEVLSVSTNDMESLPFSIGMLKSLVTLQCESNLLRDLPDSICHLENLEEMVLSHNFIVRLPSTIGMLRKLRFFCADDNILCSLPQEICSCVNLTVLSVRSNKLTELPKNVGQLVNLLVLNLVDNCIVYLPVSLLSLTKLTALWISDNQSQPLVSLQYLNASDLTCFMLPQQPVHQQNAVQSNEYTDNISANSWIHQQEQEKLGDIFSNCKDAPKPLQKIYFAEAESDAEFMEGAITPPQICFAKGEIPDDAKYVTQNSVTSPLRRICFADEVKGTDKLATRLMRSPTPYPKELRLMAKYVRTNHGQLQQQHVPYIDNSLLTHGVESASIPPLLNQVDYSKCIPVASPITPVDSVKKARVLLNPGGNAALLHNSLSYHLIDRSRNMDAEISEGCKNSHYVSDKQNTLERKTLEPIYQTDINIIKNQCNEIYSAHQHISKQSIDMAAERLTPTSLVNQVVVTSQQQQHYQPYKNVYNQFEKNGIEQDYPQSHPICDHQVRGSLFGSSGSVPQISASPSIQFSYSQQGLLPPPAQSVYSKQINKPPPYHIARAFTKKSREDLLSYDTIRSQITYGNETDTNDDLDCTEIINGDNGYDNNLSPQQRLDNSNQSGCLNDNDYHSIDHQNNNSNNMSRIYSTQCEDHQIKRRCLQSLPAAENGSLNDLEREVRPLSRLSLHQQIIPITNCDVVNECNSDIIDESQLNSNSNSWSAPLRSNSTTTWLFGLHKNPTVKQVSIKRDHEIGFEIQEKPNQGIFVCGTHPNTSAATLLHANDKLLEVDGYDFTKICLLDAQQILDNSGPVINVMISRT